MELPEPDALNPQPPPARMRLLDEVLRPAQRRPLIRTRSRKARLGRHHEAPIRMQRLADELLRHVRPVRIRRVDEVDADLRETPKGTQRLGAIRRIAPDA